MKRFVRIICLVLAIALSCSILVYAEESSTWASVYFVGFDAYLTRTSSTGFDVYFEVDATRGMDELGTSVIKVQRSSDGTNWTTMKTFYKESYSQMICEDTSFHEGTVPYTGTAGYYYRAKVTFYATYSGGTGEYTVNTEKIKL